MKLKKPAHYKEILDALESVWGNEAHPSPELASAEPLDGLILTVLSQHTNDKNRDKAFANLKQIYPTWEQVNGARTEEIADAIRTAGLGNTKAEKIKKILPLIKEKFGDYSIKELGNWDVKDAYEYLVGLPEKMPADKIQAYLEATLPPERFRGAHLNMIEHGRGICDARKPKCGECPARKWCAYGKSIDG